jgi:hypothetical protein
MLRIDTSGASFYRCRSVAQRPERAQPGRIALASAPETERCSICLERVPARARVCPECGEPLGQGATAPTGIRSWLVAHWRPVVTLTAITALLGSGVALRFLAPEAFTPARSTTAQSVRLAEPACDVPCWNGEACELGACVFRPGNDVGHLPTTPSVAGPFPLPIDVVDVLAVDGERYLASSLSGVQVASARSGEPLSLISDAPQARSLHRVGDAIYVSAMQRIHVVDPGTMTVQKSIEVGWPVGDLAVGAAGARVIVSLPGARAVAVLATDYHAEVARFTFGDDPVGAVALDDAGKRAMTSNGYVPPPGQQASSPSVLYGASYAFDPSRLPSQQDRIRTGLEGNPVDVMMAPNASTSFVVLRERDAVVPLEHPPNESIRQLPPIGVCAQPEQIELVRDGRRAVVRCNAGRAVEVLDLARRASIRRIELNAKVSDLVVTPDGRQAVLALPRDGNGAVGLLDLTSYELQVVPLRGEAHRVRITPDGKVALAVSDTTKQVWVLR